MYYVAQIKLCAAFCTVIFFLVLLGGLARSAEPRTTPLLRPGTAMHTAPIRSMAIDENSGRLVTGSEDKTVKVWELQTGKLVRTLRPPIDHGNEGMIFALALSPDGKTIACGGWTGWDWDRSASVYFFDPDNGNLVRTITNLPTSINKLAYSNDGRFLAVGLGNGMRIFDAKSYSPVFTDSDYAGRVIGLSFDRANRLVSASWDGYLRLYDYKNGAFALIKKQASRGETRPHTVAFSPDNTRIAVAFDGSLNVDVISGRDLSPLYSPNTTDITSNFPVSNLVAVAWSANGNILYAGGTYQTPTFDFVIFKWSEAGRGSRTGLQAAGNTIHSILPLRGGGIVFGSGEPSFGMINSADQRVLFTGPPFSEYQVRANALLTSSDGKTVQFPISSNIPARLSVEHRSFEVLENGVSIQTPTPVAPPLTSTSALTITGSLGYSPQVNGIPLKIDPGEYSSCVAVSPDIQKVFLGTSYALRVYDKAGTQERHQFTPGLVASVNVSQDGRLLVAALGDGTIRWYRTSDLQELLAFFPHNDKKRWVLWTPSGYYDASPGAEDLIGWHVNNGRDRQADFFPISRFRAAYYRPTVVAKVLETLDEKKAVNLVDTLDRTKTQQPDIAKILPPVVSILSPKEGTEIKTAEVTVQFSIRSPTGERLTRIEARVNGNLEKAETLNIAESEIARTVRVPLRHSESTVSIVAENRHGPSQPAYVRLRWLGKAKYEGIDTRPVLRVLAIGISNYKDEALRDGVQYASKDARDFVKAVSSLKGNGYRDVEVYLLPDERAGTKDDILRGLTWIKQKMTDNDVAMIFMAGHGVNDANMRYYFLPGLAEIQDDTGLYLTAVRDSDIIDIVKYMRGIVLVFLDTCFAGNITGGTRSSSDVVDINGFVNELSNAEKQGVVFASSTGRQKSRQAGDNGAFTKALVEGLTGKAVLQGSNKITVSSLGVYLGERVRDLTKGQQTPPRPIPLSRGENLGADFPVALKLQ